jgi:hypothetical protein
MSLTLAKVTKSTRKGKKYMAIFSDGTVTHFGGAGCGDYIIYSKKDRTLADQKRRAYIARHGATEHWRDPRTAASLSRYILWEYRTLPRAIQQYMRHFKK